MQAPPYCCGLRGKDLTACFASLAGCLLRRPLCLRSSFGRLGPLAAQSATGTLDSRSRLLRFKSFSFIFKRKKQHLLGAAFFRLVAGKGLDRLLRSARRLSPPPPSLPFFLSPDGSDRSLPKVPPALWPPARAFSGSSPSRSYSNEKNSTLSVLFSSFGCGERT